VRRHIGQDITFRDGRRTFISGIVRDHQHDAVSTGPLIGMFCEGLNAGRPVPEIPEERDVLTMRIVGVPRVKSELIALRACQRFGWGIIEFFEDFGVKGFRRIYKGQQ